MSQKNKYKGYQRTYPNGEKIHPRLPLLYGKPPHNKPNQNCKNCMFYKNNYCSLWRANIRDEYWCGKWKPKPQDSVMNQGDPYVEYGEMMPGPEEGGHEYDVTGGGGYTPPNSCNCSCYTYSSFGVSSECAPSSNGWANCSCCYYTGPSDIGYTGASVCAYYNNNPAACNSVSWNCVP